jgi:7,8-dihydropterin-6-yl-methyl-4-(beta-D-ribofuranosyl)aminobenzene 5'-phosphate synthase
MSILGHEHVNIAEIDYVEVLSLVDNSIDFLSTTDKKEVKSFRQWTKKGHGEEYTSQSQLPIAEHGFSMIVRFFTAGKSCSILFDTGVSLDGIVENARRMSLDLSEIDYIVLSHGHYDHFGGLEAVVKIINKNDLPIIAHESMFSPRGMANSVGEIRKYPEFPKKENLTPAKFIITKQPCLIANKMVCITGEIPRQTDFEKGFLQNRIFFNNKWQPDPDILDERAMILNLKQRGLIIISGCSHAGIINTIRYAQSITEVTNVYAVLGGFHLAGKEYEKRIDLTVNELRRINPQLIIPSHCTGWRAATSIAEKLPDAFIWNSVGNLYQFNCEEKNNIS